MMTNPADAYKTWLMGVRRTLQRTGYTEAAKHVGRYDRDLRGVYLSGAGTAEGAAVVSRAWVGGYAENPTTTGMLVTVGALIAAGVVLYLIFKPKPAEASPAPITGRTAPSSPTLPITAPVSVNADLCQPKSKVDAFAKSVGKHASYDQKLITADPKDPLAVSYVADTCSFYSWNGTNWAKDDATNTQFASWLSQLTTSVSSTFMV